MSLSKKELKDEFKGVLKPAGLNSLYDLLASIDAEQEIVMLNKALAAKPDFGRAWANLGVAHASGGDLDAAEEPFRNAAMYEPSAKNWINLAKLHHAKGRTELAQEAAGKARALGGL